MISARGEGLLSWMEDDNFIVEEDGSVSHNEVVVNKTCFFIRQMFSSCLWSKFSAWIPLLGSKCTRDNARESGGA